MFQHYKINLMLLVVLPALLAGCASNHPPVAIIGTWRSGIKDKQNTMTFWDNGTWTFESKKGVNQTGTYKFVSDNQFEIKVDGGDEEHPTIYKRIVSFAHHDMMHLTDADSYMRTTWKRTEQQ